MTIATHKHRNTHGALVFSLQLLFALLLLTVLTGQVFAANCTASYTYTSTGGSNNYTLNAGQSLKISSGTYNGTVEFGSGSTICVETGATFTPTNLNNSAGTLINYGTANLGTLALNAGTTIDNYSTLNFLGGLNTNNAVTFHNRSNASMRISTSFQLGSNSTFINDGLLFAWQDFNTQNGTTLTNNYRMEIDGNFNPDGAFTNNGRVYAKNVINMNSNSTIVNNCTLVSYNGFNSNNPNVTNNGTLLITQPNNKWQHNGAGVFHNGPNAKVAGHDFINNATVTGSGTMIFSGSTTNQGTFAGTSSSAKINFYDETQTGSQLFDVQNTAPTNTTRTAVMRPTELDAPVDCTTPYKNFTVTPLSCPSGQTASNTPGYATAVSGSSGSPVAPGKALGALTAVNESANGTNSAQIPNTANAYLALDLGQTVPANSELVLSLAQDVATSRVKILVSADNVNFVSVGTFGASGTLGGSALDTLTRINITAPSSGVRYVKFLREAKSLWIDGVAYSQACINAPTSTDYGDAPATYGSASHAIVAGIKLGANAPDAESASQPTHNASGDGDDEDSAPKSPTNSSITLFPLLKQTDTSYSSTFTVTNTTGTAGKLYGWIDFNKNGTFETNEATSVNVPTGSNNATVTLNWTSIPSDIKAGTTFIRLRLTTDATVTTGTPTGSASNGEVEDFPIAIALTLPPNSPNVGVTKGATPSSCSTTVFSDNFNDLTGGQHFAENRPGATPIRDWIANGGGADTRNRTDNMHNATHGTSIYMDSGAIRRIFPATANTPNADSNGVITSPPTAIELRDIADDITPNVTNDSSHWGPEPPRLSRTFPTISGQRYRLYFELLPENNGNDWRNGMLRVDTPSGSVHLQTPASGGSAFQYQVDFTANAATSTISFVNYSRIAVDNNWCVPATEAWCTIDGLSTTPKTSEPLIDNVVVALEADCVTAGSNTDFGDAPASYGNPSHVIINKLSIGNHIDADSGTLQNVNADADDTNGSPNDEDGLQPPPIIPTTVGQQYTLTTYVKNESGSTAYLTAYIDFNRDGDFLDPGERADVQHVYWSGYVQSTFAVPAGTTPGTTYARLRLSQAKAETESPIGAATSGEVEDHKLTISSGPFYDFGDAPASYGNPRHTIVNSIFLGDNRPDAELTGQHTYNARGDGVDEDGAPKQYNNPNITVFPILKMTATDYSVGIKATNSTGSAAKLYGWIDFDQNGTFDADEAAIANVANNTNSTITLTWNTIPTDIQLGTTFIRLRLTTDATVTTNTPANNASNGEVEDFPIAIAIDVPPDSPDVTIVRGEDQACSSTIFTDNFDDLPSEQYFGVHTSATPFVIRNWTATGGGSDSYARTVEVDSFAATQGRSIYFGNGMIRRFYPDTGAVLAFDGNGRMLNPPDAVELRDDVDDVSPGVNTYESDWGPEPVTLSRTFASIAGQRYRLYFSAIPEGGNWDSGMMRVDTPSGSVHFKAPGQGEGIQKYRIEFTATGTSSTIRFVNYGHIGTDNGYCDPNSVISGPWCTVGGFPVSKKGNELIIDDVAVALASACPNSGISGTVYVDTNGNNAFDAGTESGLANITVTLYDNNGTATNASDDIHIATTSTTANGAYNFAGINPSSRYRIEVDARDSDLPVSATIGTTNPLADVIVSAGSTLANQNFGFDVTCNASAGQFGGIAFRDYNQNGVREPQEEGIAGITVTAYNSANAVAATATTDAHGWYALSGLTSGTQYRLEYTNLPSGLYPGATGTDTASTVRFITASASCAANLGISDPIEYCQAVPPVAAFNFVNGNPAIGEVGNYASLFTFPYDATGGAYAQNPEPITKALTGQTGALWGMAYQKTTKTLYASATMRRFSGFGALGTGGIYKVDMTNPNAANTGASSYVDLRAIGIDTGNDVRIAGDSCNNLASSPWSPARDVAAWDKVGKVGVGDIDYDEPNNRLWLVNLNDRKLYAIGNVSPSTSPTAADVSGGYAINLPSPYTCTSGTFRPWAVKYHRGYVYVGGVCDAAADPYNLSKVRGYVLRFNPANTAAGFSHVKDFAINQPRSGFGYNTSEWSGWLPQADAVSVRPQFHSPIVGNLEFDTDGSIIVGIIDRAGLQKGTNSYDEPACADSTIDYADTMGDVLRLCKTDTGYLSDGEPGCSTVIPTNSKTTDEYYWGDLGPTDKAWEGMNEIAAGGLALAPGKEHVLASAYDANSWGSNGILWLNNITGAKDNSYHLSWTTLGKSTGMGELEVLCDPAPVEIGNRVWLDTNKDGIQDADETGIANVNVTLTCGSDSATTTTDTNGEYYFSNASDKNATFMDSGENCSLSIANSQASLTDYALTTQNADGKTDNNYQTDIRDSDAVLSGSNAVITFSAGNSGQNNHGLDFGYKPNASTEPPPSWTTQRIIDDCHGTSSYNPNGANGAENAPCQSYAQDIYENWNPSTAGSGDMDIQQCRLGYHDGTEQYYFFAWKLRENWNYDGTGESREYHVELDTDHDSASPETPARSDLLVKVQPRSSYQGNSWHAVGNSDAIIYKDANNDVGCANPGQKDTTGCSDGYETDYPINQEDAFVRILNGQVELAIKAGIVDGLNNVKARCYGSQSSTLSKDKIDWHDQNDASDLSSALFDSTGFAEVGPNVISSTISGTIYIDNNLNNELDSGTEPGIGAIAVTLRNNATNAIIATTETAASGAYSFNAVDSTLTYKIQVDEADTDLPIGATIGTPNPLTGLTVAAGETLAEQNIGFDLSNDLSYDFGDAPASYGMPSHLIAHSATPAAESIKEEIITFATGSYIIDMGVMPQTFNNGLKPYGLIYDLIVNQKIPVYWAINPTKTKDGEDFTHNGKSYKGGSFIISSEYAASAQSTLNAWKAQGVAVVGPITTPVTAPIYGAITSFPNAVLDNANGKIIRAAFYEKAGVPATSYRLGTPDDVQACDDVYILPHADPYKWPTATSSNLLNFIKSGGYLWSGCRSASGLENPVYGLKFSLLSNAGLVWDKDHGDPAIPHQFSYAAEAAPHPLMQFMGTLDDALTGGAEQVYLPLAANWRNTTTVAVWDDNQADVPTLSPGKAALIAYGHAMGNSNYGMVMYEASHNIGKNGTEAEKVAAARIVGNFILKAGIDKRIPINGISIPNIVAATATRFSINAPSASSYQWSSNCGGSFAPNSTSANVDFTAPTVASPTTCLIRVEVRDACGRNNFAVRTINIGEAAVYLGNIPPDAENSSLANDTAKGDDNTGIDDEDAFAILPDLSTASTSYSLDVPVLNATGQAVTLQAWLDLNGNGIFEPSERQASTITATKSKVSLTWGGLAGLTTGTTYARFRVSSSPLSDDVATPVDERSLVSASNGEVEDYVLNILDSASLASISGTVYVDNNLNDTRDVSLEPGIANISVALYNENLTPADRTDDTLLTTVSTNGTGAYKFNGLSPNLSYRLEVDVADPDLPATLTLGTPNPLSNITVESGSEKTGQDFGFDPFTPVADIEFCSDTLYVKFGEEFNIRNYLHFVNGDLITDWSKVQFTYTAAGANDPTTPSNWHLSDFNQGKMVKVVKEDADDNTGNVKKGRYRLYAVYNGQALYSDSMIIIANSDKSSLKSGRCTIKPTGSITGQIFEDVNYGGGAGRPFGTAGTVGISDAIVELYGVNGEFLRSTTTTNGAYAFNGIFNGNYYVRVVNASIKSTRSGANGTERAVQTYHSDGLTAVTDEIGGINPASTDAPENTDDSSLDTATFELSGSGQAQSVQAVAINGQDVNGVSFGFNFDTVVNTNDSGPGSLRQFILNANLLGGDDTLTQVGRIAGKENAILELSTSDPNYTAGVWKITLNSALPNIDKPLILRGDQQATFDSTTAVPVIELNGNGGADNGLTFVSGSTGSQIRSLAITNFSGDGINVQGATTNNSFLGNSIYANAKLGINLVGGTENGFGITANDAGDTDTGANNLINYPETKVNSFGANGTKIVTYDFNLDLAAGDYRIEFFTSAAKDPSGNGEGQTFIGSKDISHPGNGSLNFKGTFNSSVTVAQGAYISATVTAKTSPDTYGSTSEFSGIRDGITTQVCDSLIDSNTSGADMVIDETNITTVIKLLEAKDANGNPITYVISGGADGNFFTITNPEPGATLDCATVKFIVNSVIITKSADAEGKEIDTRAAPPPGFDLPAGNYEAPADSDKNNVYDLQITATTADGKQHVHDLSIRVMNINEAPIITSTTNQNITEDTDKTVLTVAAQDPDANDTLSYRISGGADSSHFEIAPSTGLLRFRFIPDYDAPMDANRDNIYEVEVTVTDTGGLSNSKLFKITTRNNAADDGVVLSVRAMLQGAYDSKTALMTDNLNTLGLIPNKQPYQMQPFQYDGEETLSAMVQQATGNDAVVDWVLVELRNGFETVVARRALILQRDGDVVDPQTGSNVLHFANVQAGNYYVSVRHRNHLGVANASPVSLNGTAKALNFASSLMAVRGDETRIMAGTVALMWAGDINASNTLSANGPNNDVTSLLSSVITDASNPQSNTNHILLGYLSTDINFDGKTLFTGPNNDATLLVGNILLHPLNGAFASNYIVRSGLE